MELHQFGGEIILNGQRVQGVVNCHDFVGRSGRRQFVRLDVLSNYATAAFQAKFLPGPIDEDTPHGLSRRSEEMTATVPGLGLVAINQSYIGLVDQCRCLQRLSGRFAPQLLRGQFTQFVVDKG